MFRRQRWVLITGFVLIIVNCATVTQPSLKIEETFVPPISYDRAFDYAIKAGEDIGFNPARYPKPNREKGIVTMIPKAELEAIVDVAIFKILQVKQFILEVHIKREGYTAKGVELKVTQARGATVDREEMEFITSAYIKSLKKYWK